MSRSHRLPFALALAGAALPAQTVAYVAVPRAPSAASVWAWDSDRGRVVAVDNVAPFLWDWDGSQFAPRLGATGPTAGANVFAAYDPRRRVLLSGNGQLEWNGVGWLLVTGSQPAGQALASPAFDAARGRVVVPTATAVHEWDGAQWQVLPGGNGPAARTGAAFAYDPANARCVLYGGSTGTTIAADCWSWNGSAWTQLSANAPAGPRSSPALAFEPPSGRLVLYGGGATTTWALLGTTWTQIATTRDPGSRSRAQFVWDGQGLLLGGGSTTLGSTSWGGALWRFQNQDWTDLPGGAPAPRYDAACGYDPLRRATVVFSGSASMFPGDLLGDTWTFAGGQWQRYRGSTAPAPRQGAQFAWSTADQALVLFGTGNDTWTWNGTVWTQRSPLQSPPPRTGAALVPDPQGGVLLFGGWDAVAPGFLGDQWHWDGANWTMQTPVPVPAARAPLAAYDPVRNVVVLAGGYSLTQNFQDTWEWNGAAWVQFGNAPFLVGSRTEQLVFHPATGRVRAEAYGQYEWDGAAWTTIATGTFVPQGSRHVADLARGRIQRLSYGGFAVLTDTPAGAERYGNGCAYGSAPGLTAVGRPTPGTAAFSLAVATLAPNAPLFVAIGLQQASVPLGNGCTALVGTTLGVNFLVAAPSGQATLPIAIPNDLSLRGVSFTAQAAVVDPPRSLFAGVTISAGLLTTLGD